MVAERGRPYNQTDDFVDTVTELGQLSVRDPEKKSRRRIEGPEKEKHKKKSSQQSSRQALSARIKVVRVCVFKIIQIKCYICKI